MLQQQIEFARKETAQLKAADRTIPLKPLRNRQPSDSMGESGGRVLRDAA
jgi:hypothetical protein